MRQPIFSLIWLFVSQPLSRVLILELSRVLIEPMFPAWQWGLKASIFPWLISLIICLYSVVAGWWVLQRPVPNNNNSYSQFACRFLFIFLMSVASLVYQLSDRSLSFGGFLLLLWGYTIIRLGAALVSCNWFLPSHSTGLPKCNVKRSATTNNRKLYIKWSSCLSCSGSQSGTVHI